MDENTAANSYKPQEERTKMQKIGRTIYNSDTGEFLGRTGLSWFKITLFYIIFYACLAAFWTLMLIIFYQTLLDDKPRWTLTSSRIGGSPGLGFRPSPPDANIDSTLIWFNASRDDTVNYWVTSLKTFIEPYEKHNVGTEVKPCTNELGTTENQVCHFQVPSGVDDICSREREFGYPERKPCVLVKLNKIYDWIPEDFADGPPEELTKLLKVPYEKGFVYVTCQGENAADRDNMGEIFYYPKQGIPFKFFPFKNQDGYTSPFVFAQFENINHGVLVNVECRAWAKNIEYDRGDRLGSVHFELIVD